MLHLLARATGGEGVKSGPLGLAIILVLCVAVYFLFKSMSKHLRKVRDEFPSDDRISPVGHAAATSAPPSDSTESAAVAADPAQPPAMPRESDTSP
jgi:hypothetical protein